MGPGEIVSVDHTTMEAIWTAEGSETRAPLAEGPQGFAIAAFGKRTYRSEVPNLMLQVVAGKQTRCRRSKGSAEKADGLEAACCIEATFEATCSSQIESHSSSTHCWIH